MRRIANLWKQLLLLGVSGLSLLPAPAMAQDSGRFTLPREVRWGMVTLPAGSYRYSVEHGSSQTIILRNSAGMGAIVMASSVSTIDSSDSPKIMLQQQGSEWFVVSMVLGGEGEELHFARSPKRTEIARDTESRAKLASISKP